MQEDEGGFQVLGLDMPSLMLPFFPGLSLLLLGLGWTWGGGRSAGGSSRSLQLLAHPSSSGDTAGSEEHPPSHPQAHRGAGGLQTSQQIPSSSAGSLCACSQGKQRQRHSQAKAAGQLPLRGPEEANSHRLLPSPHGASLFSGALAGMLGADRAMGSLWSSFPAFYPAGGS